MSKKFNVGEKYFLSLESGVDSGRPVVIIPYFYWENATESGMYKAPDLKKEVPVRFEDTGTTYFVFKWQLREHKEVLLDPKDRLIVGRAVDLRGFMRGSITPDECPVCRASHAVESVCHSCGYIF